MVGRKNVDISLLWAAMPLTLRTTALTLRTTALDENSYESPKKEVLNLIFLKLKSYNPP
jgi:hypothetical protein